MCPAHGRVSVHVWVIPIPDQQTHEMKMCDRLGKAAGDYKGSMCCTKHGFCDLLSPLIQYPVCHCSEANI